MGEWKEYKLGEVTDITSSKRIFYSEYVPEGVPFYRSKEVIDKFNKRNIQTELFISEERYKVIKEKFGAPEKDDILLTSVGTLGIPYLVGENDRFYFKDGNLTWFRKIDKDRVDAKFLFLWLQSSIGQQKLYEVTIGSTQPALTIAGLKEIEIELPDLPEQKSIASVLSSLDDKIGLLHRQNKTLEALAETLFRQWFVEEAEEGWEEKSLVEIAEYLNGLALQKYPAKGIDDLPVIKIREMKQGISENTDKCSRDIPSQYIIHDGDILFSWSGSLEVVIWHDGEGALNQHLFKISSDKYPKWFYYLATKYHLANFKMIAETKSTTMGHIQREHLREATILIPPKELFAEYDNKIAPLIEKKIKNNAQIKILTHLRDTLLPKLMSGEVRVKESEKAT